MAKQDSDIMVLKRFFGFRTVQDEDGTFRTQKLVEFKAEIEELVEAHGDGIKKEMADEIRALQSDEVTRKAA